MPKKLKLRPMTKHYLGLGVLIEAIQNKPKITVKRAAVLACRAGCAADDEAGVTEASWFKHAGRTKESEYVWQAAYRRLNELLRIHK